MGADANHVDLQISGCSPVGGQVTSHRRWVPGRARSVRAAKGFFFSFVRFPFGSSKIWSRPGELPARASMRTMKWPTSFSKCPTRAQYFNPTGTSYDI